MEIERITAYKCPTCGVAFLSEDIAKHHCKTRFCEGCHKVLPRNWGMTLCDECLDKKEVFYESQRFKEANKFECLADVPDELKDCFYSEIYPDGYFFEIEDLEEYCKENSIEIPKYVWLTTKRRIYIDADSIVEMACDDLHEDAFDTIDKDEIKKLQALLDEWCKEQTGTTTYEVDYENAVLI